MKRVTRRLLILCLICPALLCLPAFAEETGMSISIATPAPAVTPEPPATPEPTPSPSPTPEPTPKPPLAGLIIGLDPGHQLVYNPHPEPVAPGESKTKAKTAGGARGVRSGVMEYEVNLNVALKLKPMLEAEGASVILTHDVLDVDLSNIDRAEIFNAANVDLGIRMHCENSSNPKTHGAFMIVPKEFRTSFYEENVAAAKAIISAYCETTGLKMLHEEGLTYRGDQTGFNWCKRPVVCIEMGCLSHRDDDALLSKDEFQTTMAEGLLKGILDYFAGQNSI